MSMKFEELKEKVKNQMRSQVTEVKTATVEQWAKENGFTDVYFNDYEEAKNWVDENVNTNPKLRKDFYKFSEQAGVPKIRLYDLRHTYVATMMSEGKELYFVSPRLGHVNYSTTVNKYGHLSNQARKEVALTTDKYL